MPPELNIRRFKGLRLYYPKSEKASDELAQATNVMFDKEGALINRPGFDHISGVTPGANGTGTQQNTGDPLCWWVAPATSIPWLIFQKSDRVWGTPGPTTAMIEFGATTIGTNEAVVYDGKIYFASGHWWNGVALAAHPGMPTNRESMAIHKDRLFVCTRNNGVDFTNYRVYFSEPGIPDTGAWPAANFIDVRTGTPNRAVISYRDQIFVFKPDSVHVLSTGGLPANWTLRKLGEHGCVGGPVVYNNVLYWLGQSGVYSYNGVSISKLSDPIQKFFDENPISYDDTCQVIGYDGNLYIQLKLENGNRVFWLYNLKMQAWTVIDPPFGNKTGRMLMLEERTGGASEPWTRGVYFGSGEDATLKAIHRPHLWRMDPARFQDQSYLDADVDFSILAETAQIDFEEPHRKKRVHLASIEGIFDHLTIDQYDEDGRTKQKVFSNLDETKVSLLKFPGIGYCRSLRFKLSGLVNPGGIKILGLRAQVKQRGQQIEQQTAGTYADQP